MAKKNDYFGLDRIVSIVLVIIPFTSWICGVITRAKEGAIVATIIRAIFGFTIVWILDIIGMIVYGKIFRLLNF